MADVSTGHADTTPLKGIRNNTPAVHALTNARVITSPGNVIENATIVIRDGVIVSVGAEAKIPADARVWDYSGMTIYPGLIETYSHLGFDKDTEKPASGAPYWNADVTPEVTASSAANIKAKDIESYRSLGFTTALVVPTGNGVNGAASLIHLGGGSLNDELLTERVGQGVNLVFKYDPQRIAYPTSLMGKIALIRQAMIDARWYESAQTAYKHNPSQERPEANDALAALAMDLTAGRPLLFKVGSDLSVLRAAKIASEFEQPHWILGAGTEYRITDHLLNTEAELIVPVSFPDAPDVSSPEAALEVTLAALQHWESAPANAAFLAEKGITFALTTDGLKKRGTFHHQVEMAIDRGLSPDVALAALTTEPARMLGMSDVLGTIERGKVADFVVTDGALFTKKTHVVDVWVDGSVHHINKRPEADPRGTWVIATDASAINGVKLEIGGTAKKLSGKAHVDTTATKLKSVSIDHHRLALAFSGKDAGVDGVVTMSGGLSGSTLAGHGQLPDGSWFDWTATMSAPNKEDEKSKKDPAGMGTVTVGYGAFAATSAPEQPKHVFVDNATIWTSGPAGRLENASMLISNGVIKAIGDDLKAPKGAVVIDGAGKHITAGLIDAHSHTGVNGGVNEYGQAVSAEVRIEDVIDPTHIGWYRELAGGLTAANILHGSANPIGGQMAVVKIRRGGAPEAMLIEDAIPGIKFALGENVKQANWGDEYTTRYPQTRMGVEQIIRDRFQAASEYADAWEKYKKKKGVIPPRRDLELETLVQILRGERLIHCHSYRQDEILMLMRVAEDFGFTIGVFQHVLEGYKVADELAKHGAMASTFSDWWAYKFEVYDAIPYNGALMHEQGVVVSFNSDSSELARRMNLEAAKAVKYGGVSASEALKFVTLNPARQLRIDHRVGSLEKSKDGDFVVWSGSPLSTLSHCEQTWIDGRKYFDKNDDMAMRADVTTERSRLIQKALAAGDGKGSKGAGAASAATEENYECTHGTGVER